MGLNDGRIGGKLDRIGGKLDMIVSKSADVLRFMAMALLVIAMLLMTVDSIMRYVFSAPIPGAFYIEAFILVALISFPLAYCQKTKANIRVDIIISKIHGRPFYIIELVTLLFALVLFALATYTTAEDAWRSFITGNYEMGIVKLPIWPSKVFIPIGTGFLCLVLMVDIMYYARAIFRRMPIATALPEELESKGLM